MKFIVVPCVLASCLGIGWAVFVDSQHQVGGGTSPDGEEVHAVKVTRLQTRDIVEALELVGSLEADRDVEIRSRVSGRIEELAVDVGDRISKGQLLIQVDDLQQKELVRQAEAAIRVTVAEKSTQDLRVIAARREHDRQQNLATKGVGTAQQLEAAESKLSIAEAESRLAASKVAQAETELEQSRLELAERRIESPLDGQVASRTVQVGDLAKSDVGLLRIVDLSTVRTAVHVGESDYRQLREGQPAEVRVDTYPDPFPGRVVRLAPVLDPETRTAVVYIAVENPDGLLKPGMHARVRVVLDRHEQATAVPLASVVETPEGSTVFVLADDGGRVSQVSVRLGLADRTMVEVLSGVDPADRVVTLGSHLVRDGQVVEVVD